MRNDGKEPPHPLAHTLTSHAPYCTLRTPPSPPPFVSELSPRCGSQNLTRVSWVLRAVRELCNDGAPRASQSEGVGDVADKHDSHQADHDRESTRGAQLGCPAVARPRSG